MKIIFIILITLAFSYSSAEEINLDPTSSTELSKEYKVGHWDMIILEDKMGRGMNLTMQVASVETFIGEGPKAIFGFVCDKNITSMITLNEFSSLRSDGIIENSDMQFQKGLIRLDNGKAKEFQFNIAEASNSEKLLFFGIWDIEFEKKYYTANRVRVSYSTGSEEKIVTFMTKGFEKAFIDCMTFHERMESNI